MAPDAICFALPRIRTMTAYANIRIGTKLGISFGVVIFLLVVLCTVSVMQTRTTTNLLEEQSRIRTQKLEQLYVVREALGQTGLAARNAYIFSNEDEAAKELALLDQQKTIYLDALAGLTPLFDGNADFDAMRKDLLAMAEELKRPRQYVAAKNMEEFGKFLVNECSPLRRKIVAEIDVVIKAVQQAVETDGRNLEEATAQSGMLILLISAIAVAISIAVAVAITRGLLQQLGGEPSDVRHIASRIAAGDLTVAISTRRDDDASVVAAMKNMRDSLADVVAKIRASTDTISSASTQIASGNQDLAARTEQQASALEETASSMKELNTTVKQNTEHAHQANDLASAASSVAVRGGQVVSKVVVTMGEINDSAAKISDIISVIDGIAFQTNILALNAAVEAARAGEQGRGFAVVATEVRTLAQRSAAAAKEIKLLISDSVEKVSTGSQLVGLAGSTMNEIVQSVKRVNDIMAEITAASHEQSTGLNQVNQAVGRMDQVTQQNAALVEQAAATAESLRQQASSLLQLVSRFEIGDAAEANSH